MTISYRLLADVYGSGTYNNNTYQYTGNTGSTTQTNNGGTLPATGVNIVYGLVGGILLIVVAIAIIVSMRRKKKAQSNS